MPSTMSSTVSVLRCPAHDRTLSHLANQGPPPASLVTEIVASRARGGARKAEPKRNRRWRFGRTAEGGKRARRDGVEGLLVDASDAASQLAMAATTWDATQILAHAEIARLALTEALSNLDEERAGADTHHRQSRKKRVAAHRDIQERFEGLIKASELLADAHARNLVKGD